MLKRSKSGTSVSTPFGRLQGCPVDSGAVRTRGSSARKTFWASGGTLLEALEKLVGLGTRV